MNLFTPEQKAAANQAMKDVFDSFKRDEPVRFYKASKEAVVIDSNFSKRWDQTYNNIPKTPEYQDFYCIIAFSERDPVDNLIAGADKNIRYVGDYSRCTLQMELDAYQYFLQGVERFEHNGIQYRLEGGPRPLGILGTINVYEIKLQKVN